MADGNANIRVTIDTSGAYGQNQQSSGSEQRQPSGSGVSLPALLAADYYLQQGKQRQGSQPSGDPNKWQLPQHVRKAFDLYAADKSVSKNFDKMVIKALDLANRRAGHYGDRMGADPRAKGSVTDGGQLELNSLIQEQTQRSMVRKAYMSRAIPTNYIETFNKAGGKIESVFTTIGKPLALAAGFGASLLAPFAKIYAAYKTVDYATQAGAYGAELIGGGPAIGVANGLATANRAIANIMNFPAAMGRVAAVDIQIASARAVFGQSPSKGDLQNFGALWALERLNDRIERDQEMKMKRFAAREFFYKNIASNGR